ncbi:hypothetical protein KEM56_004667, partial [Ascosphaera pollenicola]
LFVELAKEIRLFIQQRDGETREDDPRTWEEIVAFWDVLGGVSLERHGGLCVEDIKEVTCRRIRRRGAENKKSRAQIAREVALRRLQEQS